MQCVILVSHERREADNSTQQVRHQRSVPMFLLGVRIAATVATHHAALLNSSVNLSCAVNSAFLHPSEAPVSAFLDVGESNPYSTSHPWTRQPKSFLFRGHRVSPGCDIDSERSCMMVM